MALTVAEKKRRRRGVVLSFRVSEETSNAIDRLFKAEVAALRARGLSAEEVGRVVTRADVMRRALLDGLQALEADPSRR